MKIFAKIIGKKIRKKFFGRKFVRILKIRVKKFSGKMCFTLILKIRVKFCSVYAGLDGVGGFWVFWAKKWVFLISSLIFFGFLQILTNEKSI